MSKTKRFEIYDDEPNGPTFDEDGKGDGIYDRLAGSKNTKRKARFGINANEPSGETYEDPRRSHIDFPKADRGPVLGNKVVASSSGQGEYEPEASGGRVGGRDEFPGIPGIGKSSPKRGQMKYMKGFK